MSAHGHILNSYDCCQLKNSSITSSGESERKREGESKVERGRRRGQSELRTFTVFPLTTPFRPVISRKIKVNPPLVQLHLRDTVMAHFHTRWEIRRDEYECRRKGETDIRFLSIAISNSTHDTSLFVTAYTLLLYNFVSMYSRH